MERPRPIRPPSYSDSFFFLPDSSEPLIHVPQQDPYDTLSTPPTSVPHNLHSLNSVVITQLPSRPYTVYERWFTRGLSFTCHLCLISIFETVFFFQYVSVSEDTGLQSTLDSYLASILNNCRTWPSNETVLINDVLSLLINVTQVEERGQVSALQRHSFNGVLQARSWLMVSVISSLFLLTGVGSCVYRLRIAWRRMMIENCVMILMLGLYELMFFSLIVYNYENMEQPELDAFLVRQLQQTCGLLEA